MDQSILPLSRVIPVGAQLANNTRVPLVGMTLVEMTDFLASLGEPKFRAKQLFGWVYAKAAQSFDEMTNLSASLRAKLAERAELVLLTEETRQEAAETSTTKFLFQLLDGQKVETVLMEYTYGNSVCVTTQVGCQQGCTFCASTFGGLVRNLSAGEIVSQIIMCQNVLPEGERISHVVFMGSGEPMENYDEVVKALRLLHEPEGLNISYRHMTVSTSGIVEPMRKLADEGMPITLALSLHAPTDNLRSRLMPVNRRYPLANVVAAAREYGEKTGRRVTYEYLLIEGVNDNPEQAEELAHLLRGSLAHVNLIPINPVAERPEYQRPDRSRVDIFVSLLESRGIAATVRREMGGEIDAACGQLRNRLARQRRNPRS